MEEVDTTAKECYHCDRMGYSECVFGCKEGKIYHLSEARDDEEDIRATLRKKPRCFRCKKDDHTASECIFGSKRCHFCNYVGHSYDDCVERMVTKREIRKEVERDPYYDPWVYERIQYE